MDRKKYKVKLKGLEGLQRIPRMKDDVETVIESRDLLDKLYKVMLDYQLDYGIKWMLGLESYLNDKKGGKTGFSAHLDRGHIVEVEFFGHFDKELTFLHPAVVLYDDNSGWMLVAPISTSKHGNPNPFYIDVDQNDGLKHNCAVCLDALRVIDKKRVTYQYDKDGANSKVREETLDLIDETILQYFMPMQYQRFITLDIQLKKEQREHEKTKQELQILKEKMIKEVAVSSDLISE